MYNYTKHQKSPFYVKNATQEWRARWDQNHYQFNKRIQNIQEQDLNQQLIVQICKVDVYGDSPAAA